MTLHCIDTLQPTTHIYRHTAYECMNACDIYILDACHAYHIIIHILSKLMSLYSCVKWHVYHDISADSPHFYPRATRAKRDPCVTGKLHSMEVLRHGHDMPIWVKRFKVHSCLILKSEDVALESFFSQHTAFDTTNQVIYQPFWGITPIRFASSLVVRSLPSVDLVAIRIFAVREVSATPAEVQLGRHVVAKSGCHSPTRSPGPTGTTWIYGGYIYIYTYMYTCIYI